MIVTHRTVTLSFALCATLVGPKIAWATLAAEATSDNSYFVARQDIIFDDVSKPTEKIASYHRNWLRSYRAIKSNPRLSRRFMKRRDLGDKFVKWPEQLKKLGLTQKQVQQQPDFIYTLLLASYRKPSSLQFFLKNSWLKRKMPTRHVYKQVPKAMRLSVNGGEVVVKSDPLYTEQKIIRRKTFTRLCYGLYEDMTDANRDRKVLEQCLGLRTIVLRSALSKKLVTSIWFIPVSSGKSSRLDWETQ